MVRPLDSTLSSLSERILLERFETPCTSFVAVLSKFELFELSVLDKHGIMVTPWGFGVGAPDGAPW